MLKQQNKDDKRDIRKVTGNIPEAQTVSGKTKPIVLDAKKMTSGDSQK